ncbi:hypothetical protein NVP1079O_51 [Vibrio phage 1.079.O._10N.286.45.E9]|nr:hypothetical protein NVP1079O_51 [Vibrio phage 1.079.O._10N.286.45.E9]
MKGKYFIQMDKIENCQTLMESERLLSFSCSWEEAVRNLNITFTNRKKFWQIMLSELPQIKLNKSDDMDFFIDSVGSNYYANVNIKKFENAVNYVLNAKFERISDKKVRYKGTGFQVSDPRFPRISPTNLQCHT